MTIARLFLLLMISHLFIGLSPSTGAWFVSPELTIQPANLNFDTVMCNTTKHMPVSFAATADGSVKINRIDSMLAMPFATGSTGYPKTILPGTNLQAVFTYTAGNSPSKDSLRIFVTGNFRVSMTVGYLFDVSSTMNDQVSTTNTAKKIEQAKQDALEIIDKIVTKADISDLGAVFAFEDAPNYSVKQDFTASNSNLYTSIPTTATGAKRCLINGMSQSLDRLKLQPNKKALIVFTDGSDNCSGNYNNLISDALAAGIKIYIIGYGTVADSDTLKYLAQSTGGFYLNQTELATGGYKSIFDDFYSNNTKSILLTAETVTPHLTITPTTLDFGLVKQYDERCLPVVLKNDGNAPLIISDMNNIAAPFRFSIVPSFPLQAINPGDEITMDICFSPQVTGNTSALSYITHNACGEPLQVLTLKGQGENAPLGAILRIDMTDFDTTMCKTKKCQDMIIRNVGDTVLTVYKIDSLLAPPFTMNNIAVPFTVQPNGSQSITVCYQPQNAPQIDTNRIYLRADTRNSMSLCLLFDVSGSMGTSISGSDPTLRINAAKTSGTSFINSLLNTTFIKDEAAICSFDASYYWNQDFTMDKTLLKNAIQSLTPQTSTCLYYAIMQTIDKVKVRNNKRAIIVLTDGADNCSTSSYGPADIVASANTANVQIFTIGIGEATPGALQTIAAGTGGQFFSASNTKDLIGVYRTIATLLGKNMVVNYLLKGRAVTPNVSLSPASLDFDSVKVGQSRCLPFRITNSGDAPLIVSSISTPADPFSFQTNPTLPSPEILPGESMNVTLCFTPSKLRVQTGKLNIQHNSCSQPDFVYTYSGVGYDSLNIKLYGDYSAKPGSNVVFNVVLKDKVPLIYDINSFSISFRCDDKTMLFPLDTQNTFFKGTLSQSMTNLTAAYSPDAKSFTYSMNLSGGLLVNPGGDTSLMKVGFLSLLGDSLQTHFSIISAKIADGNPKINIINPATYNVDSLCYLGDKLLNPYARINAPALEAVPNPVTDNMKLIYLIRESGPVNIKLYDLYGSEVKEIFNGELKAGEYSTELLTPFPAGMYYLRLSSAGFLVNKSIIVVK